MRASLLREKADNKPLQLALAGIRLVHLEADKMLSAGKVADVRPEGVHEPILDEKNLNRRRDVDIPVSRLVDDRSARRVNDVDSRGAAGRRDRRESNQVWVEV